MGESMDIRNFITFNSVVENSGFTKAAGKLNYAQSTVTLHIKELETHYDAMLFDRMNKKIYLTPFGERLYEKTKSLVNDYSDILDLNSKSQSAVILRIGVYESLLKYRLYGLIQEYKNDHPNVDIIMQHGTCKSLRQMIRQSELDLTFQIEPIKDFVGLKSSILCHERFHLILPKHNSIDFIYEPTHTVYLTEKDCSYRKVFEDYLDDKGVIRQQIMETGSVDIIKQYVSLGLGYSMIPTIALDASDTHLEMTEVEVEDKLYTQLLHHKDKTVFPAMKDFIDLIIKVSKNW
jgi:DNA-binding transcriptional LysR family regulator